MNMPQNTTQLNVISGQGAGHDQLLTSFQRRLLENNLQDNISEQYRQRIQIMLLANEGKTQSQICDALGCSQGTARHWILMARTGQAHRWQEMPIGRPKAVTDQYLERLKGLVSNSPRMFGYPFRRWTGKWLSKHLSQEFGIEVSDRHINRLLKQMGLSTRPQAAQPDPSKGTGEHILIRDLTSVDVAKAVELGSV